MIPGKAAEALNEVALILGLCKKGGNSILLIFVREFMMMLGIDS